jgi:hypothetical protein
MFYVTYGPWLEIHTYAQNEGFAFSSGWKGAVSVQRVCIGVLDVCLVLHVPAGASWIPAHT